MSERDDHIRGCLPRARPLAPIQRQLWLAEQVSGGPARYNIAAGFWLEGPLDAQALADAVDLMVARHEALRAVVVPRGDDFEQVFAAPTVGVLRRIELTAIPPEHREAEALSIAHAAAGESFDLSSGLLLRAVLVGCAPDLHVFVLVVHHAAADGWSLDILRAELSSAYRALHEDRAPDEAPHRESFGDVVAGLARALGPERRESLTRWWRERLAGAPERWSLPGAGAGGDGGTRAGLIARRLDDGAAQRVSALARASRVTPFIVLLAAWQALLARWSGERDLVVGCPVLGRGTAASERVVGCFVNLLPIRVDTGGARSFAELLPRVRDALLAACTHADLAYPDIVAAHEGRAPVKLAFALHARATPLSLGAVAVRRIELERGGPKFELLLEAFTESDGLRLELEHDRAAVDDATAACVLDAFVALVQVAVESPATPLASLPVMAAAERRRVLETFNDTAVSYPRNACIQELVREHVLRAPDAVAVVCDAGSLTYREVWNAASALADELTRLGVAPDDRVAVCLERSLELVPALLGILIAGGCYVPLDPRYPRERLTMMCDDAAPRAVVAGAATAALASGLGPPVAIARARGPDAPPRRGSLGAERLAYVCYTSGSTGKPKGVAVPHRGVVRLVRGSTFASFEPRQVFLHHSPLAFDASTFEIWGPLANGGTVALMPPGAPGLDELVDAIGRHRVTTAFLTTGLFNLLVDERLEGLARLEQILFGGEACSPDHVARARRGLPRCRLVHAYGPTESTTFATCHEVTPGDLERGTIPIGRPIANTTAYVLDSDGQPVPAGVAGELFLGGDGIARGYLARPELTAERFLSDPFRGGTMYRTGDLVRWRRDGRMEFLGRRDDQVKIRGFRIEPGEIEARAIAHPGVARAHVGTLPDARGGRRLVAWVVPCGDSTDLESIVREHLAATLPEHMVPAAIVVVDRLPLSASGKVDRSALPAPAPVRTVPVRPRDPVEATLIELFEEVLGARGIGVHDSFFDLGGHSLLVARLAAHIESRMGQRVPLITFFEARTVAELAARLRGGVWTVADGLVMPLEPRGERPPLFWIHSLGGDRSGSFMYYRTLARLLGAAQPSFGVRSPEAPIPSIEAMAIEYAAAVSASYPAGPILLGGFCFGGVVAYEMARALTRAGRHVALVALIESYPPRAAEPAWTERLAAVRHGGLANTLRRAQRWLSRRTSARQAPHRVWELLDRSTYPDECVRAAEIHWDALQAYRPGPYAGRVVLFRSSQNETGAHDWGALAPENLQVVELDAAHEGIVRPPAVDFLAETLTALVAASLESGEVRSR